MNIDIDELVPGDDVWLVEIHESRQTDPISPEMRSALRLNYYLQAYIQKGIIQRMIKPDGTVFNIAVDNDYDSVTRAGEKYKFYATLAHAIDGVCELLQEFK